MCGTNKPPFSRNILLINKFSDNPPCHVSGTVGSRDPRKTWPCPSWGPPCYRGRSSRLFWTVIARERMHFDSYVAWEWGQRLHWLWNQSIKIFVTEMVFYLRQLRVHVIDDTLKICKIIPQVLIFNLLPSAILWEFSTKDLIEHIVFPLFWITCRKQSN